MSILPMPKLLMKSLFNKPVTRMYPVVKQPYDQSSRGHIINDMMLCNFCTLCEKRCPTGAIKVKRNEKTWIIDPLQCITCQHCIDGCAQKSLSMRNEYTAPVGAGEKKLAVLTLKGVGQSKSE